MGENEKPLSASSQDFVALTDFRLFLFFVRPLHFMTYIDRSGDDDPEVVWVLVLVFNSI